MTIKILVIDDDIDLSGEIDGELEAHKQELVKSLSKELSNAELADRIYISFHEVRDITDVEDIKTERSAVETTEQIEAYNDIQWADIILADVRMPETNQDSGKKEEQNVLYKIINKIKVINQKNLPMVVALTIDPVGASNLIGRDLAYEDLVAIWPKRVVNGKYRAWCIARLMKEKLILERKYALCRMIGNMEESSVDNVEWHRDILILTSKYMRGFKEPILLDQVKSIIETIGNKVAKRSPTGGENGEFVNYWSEVIAPWEKVERAAIEDVRGHARHVLNVFWMGYYLLSNPYLQPMFKECFKNWIEKNKDYLNSKGISNIANYDDSEISMYLHYSWFIAALFHDVGNCIAKKNRLEKELNDIYDKFQQIEFSQRFVAKKITISNFNYFDTFVEAFNGDTNFQSAIKELGKTGIDSGLVGAMLVNKSIFGPESERYLVVSAAIGAIAAHNGISKLSEGLVVWKDNPITCLLVLCDQLQTWDRQRGDEDIHSQRRDNPPHLAELLDINITQKKGKVPNVNIDINYVFEETQGDGGSDSARDILRANIVKYPNSALKKIEEWPFRLKVCYYLEYKNLDCDFSA